MPITADRNNKNYVLGRGRVYFDRFPTGITVTASTKGEGRRYIGNTPEFATTSETENLDHFDSDAGINTKDASVQLSMNRSGSMSCDNINLENTALLFLGTMGSITQTTATAQTYTVTAQSDRAYQLGESETLPTGYRNVSNVAATVGGTPLTPDQFQVDEARGVVYIMPGVTALATPAATTFTFDVAASKRDQVISSSNPISGALWFEANNGFGANRDYYFPYVTLAPDGDYNLKGDDWQAMGFTFEILTKGALAAVYIDGMPGTV